MFTVAHGAHPEVSESVGEHLLPIDEVLSAGTEKNEHSINEAIIER